MVDLVNSHTKATRIGWHLWEIDLGFAPGLPPGWGMHANELTPFLAEKNTTFQTLSGNLCTWSCFRWTNRAVDDVYKLNHEVWEVAGFFVKFWKFVIIKIGSLEESKSLSLEVWRIQKS